jgi:hypothetical protein
MIAAMSLDIIFVPLEAASRPDAPVPASGS